MYALGKLPVTLSLGKRKHNEEMHIYSNVSGIIISWKAAKALGILSDQYPNPFPLSVVHITTKPSEKAEIEAGIDTGISPHQSEITRAFPTVFDEQVRTMEGEEFHISLMTDAKPFCNNTPRSIPLAYQDKLKAELDSLLSQEVIAPVTEATAWCAPIVVTPKKNTYVC